MAHIVTDLSLQSPVTAHTFCPPLLPIHTKPCLYIKHVYRKVIKRVLSKTATFCKMFPYASGISKPELLYVSFLSLNYFNLSVGRLVSLVYQGLTDFKSWSVMMTAKVRRHGTKPAKSA
jgi:hypothetical protein